MRGIAEITADMRRVNEGMSFTSALLPSAVREGLALSLEFAEAVSGLEADHEAARLALVEAQADIQQASQAITSLTEAVNILVAEVGKLKAAA